LQDFFKLKKMKTQIKSIISFVLSVSFLMTAAPMVGAESRPMEKRKLLVTAYYSPLPNQSFYIRGSYKADIRLNGRGTNGADGTEVYTGMLAAPKTYPFGTRVKIPGLGVGEVHDRGGAILPYADYDRIDVWMGRGEEGLARALNWGSRLVEGEVYFTPHQVEPGLSFNWISAELPSKTLARLKNKTVQNPEKINKVITEQSAKDDVKELQQALSNLGYFKGPVTGTYGPITTEAVLAFQLAENVIPSKDSPGAGHYGPKTRAALKSKVKNYNEAMSKEIDRLERNRELLASGLGKASEGEKVMNLQRMLWELGYYYGDLDGVYNDRTIDAVFKFQTDQDILSTAWDRGAGYYGPKTHDALTAAIDNKLKRVSEFPKAVQVWVPAKRPLPKIASLAPPPVVMERQELHFAGDLMNKKIVQSESDQESLSQLDLNDRGDQVVKLQNILIRNGHLQAGLNTGYYGLKTQAAVLAFQIEKGIVSSGNDLGAGRVGPKTLSALRQA
jgi:peptidoglycan hydrolase-like protein with peptidoglycan-binding domain/3D (Asp-Asp-Asp) domain-containing protein